MRKNNHTPITNAPNSALPALLEAWNRHHDNRRNSASIPELVESRRVLDAIRLNIR